MNRIFFALLLFLIFAEGTTVEAQSRKPPRLEEIHAEFANQFNQLFFKWIMD